MTVMQPFHNGDAFSEEKSPEYKRFRLNHTMLMDVVRVSDCMAIAATGLRS